MLTGLLRGLVIVAAALVTAGCAMTTQIRALQPAEVSAAASLQTIGVAPFEQRARRHVSLDAKIETELAKYQLEPGVNYYIVVDRSNLDSVIKEQKFQLSGLSDRKNAAKVGRLAGAQALVVGNISAAGVEDRRYYENRVRNVNCDQKGKNCQRQEYSVRCTARTVTVGAQVKLTDIERGDFITANNYSKSKTWKQCDDGGADLGQSLTNMRCLFGNGCSAADQIGFPAGDQGLEILADEIAANFVHRLVPHYVVFKVNLYKSPEVKLEGIHKERFKAANEFIKAGRLDRAEELLALLMDATQGQSYVITYNYGVIAEAKGQFDEALKLYQAADRLTMRPEKNISEALIRIQRIISDEKRANEQINKQAAL